MTVDIAKPIIAAPFIGPSMFSDGTGATFLERKDRPGRMVRDSSLVRAVLEGVAEPRTPGTLMRDLLQRGHSGESVLQAVDELIDVNFIEDTEHIDLRLPSVELELTNVCNADCIMCPRKDLRPLGMMTPETFEQSVELIRSVGTGVILQGLGEATLHRDLENSIRRLRGAIGPELPIVLVTNGFRMSAERLSELIDAGLSLLQWSFHSLRPDVYNEIMGAKRFKRAFANLVECAVDHADHLYINYVEMAENRDEFPNVLEFAEKIGIPRRRVGRIPVFNRGGTIDSLALGGSEAQNRVPRCVFASKALFVAWNGDVMPCSNDTRAELVYGNVSAGTDRVLELWQRQRLGKPFDSGPCVECDHATRETMDTAWFDLASLTATIRR
jgi:MoaA/NifB/PqqE/SkfB family radical SAM enzyme